MIRTFLALAVCASTVATPLYAQDTLVVLDIADINVKLGDTALIPIIVVAPTDSIAGFTIPLALDRPQLLEFHDDYAVEQLGTLVSDWEVVTGNAQFSTSLLITAIPEGTPISGPPGPLPPIMTPQTLVYAVGIIPCFRDPFGDNDVRIDGSNAFTHVSDPQGQLIEPVAVHSGIVTIQPPTLGDLDQSGELNIADVVAVVACAFRASCPVCGNLLGDLNCSGAVDVVDVVMEVEHVFRGGNQPFCF